MKKNIVISISIVLLIFVSALYYYQNSEIKNLKAQNAQHQEDLNELKIELESERMKSKELEAIAKNQAIRMLEKQDSENN